MTPSHLVIFLKGYLLQISSSLEVMLEYFSFTEFCVLELFKDDCWFHRVRCAWILPGSSELSFLVNWLGSNLPCLLCLTLDLDQSCRDCFRFYYIFLFVFVSRERYSVSFLVLFLADTEPFFLFLFCLIWYVGTWSFLRGTWCRMFVLFRFKYCILMRSRMKSYGRLTDYIT